MQQESNKEGLKRKRESVSFETLVNPNFEELCRQFPFFQSAYRKALAEKSNKGGKLDVSTPEFSLALARALLSVHWNLDLPLFDSNYHLCPPIPNRYFFVQWLQTTVLPATQRFFETTSRPLSHRGLDIGTGAAAIYALLYAATSSSMTTIYATDIDPNAVRQALGNVQANHLESQVHVLLVEPTEAQKRQQQQHHHQQEQQAMRTADDMETKASTGVEEEFCMETSHDDLSRFKGPLRCSLDAIHTFDSAGDAATDRTPAIDFCMTNPPFFDLTSETTLPPPRADGRARVTMTNEEGSYPGGEFAFLVDMVADGLYLYFHQKDRQPQQQQHQQPLWSSCMCGKKTTGSKLKGILHSLLGYSHVLSTEFGPGFMTRWFLAWTFERPKLDSKLAYSKSFSFSVVLPDTTPTTATTPAADKHAEITKRVCEYCESFPVASLVVDVSSVDPSKGRQRLRIRPRHTEAVASTEEDSRFPEPIQRVLSSVPSERRLEWLPRAGQFCVDIVLIANTTAAHSGPVQLQVTTFAHTRDGQTVVDKIQVQLEGEICRTNRKWRRILQRQQQPQHPHQRQHHHHQQQDDQAQHDRMDES